MFAGTHTILVYIRLCSHYLFVFIYQQLFVIFLSVTYEVPVLTSTLFQQTPLCDFIGLVRSIFQSSNPIAQYGMLYINHSKEVYMAKKPETEVSDGNKQRYALRLDRSNQSDYR